MFGLLEWGTTVQRWPLGASGKSDDIEEALAIFRRTLEIRRRIGDKIEIENTFYDIAGGIWRTSDGIDEAETLQQEALALQRHTGSPADISLSLQALAHHALLQGDVEAARRGGEEALQLARQIGNIPGTDQALMVMCTIDIVTDQIENAQRHLEEALSLGLEGTAFHSDHVLSHGFIHLGLGEWDEAEQALIEFLNIPARNIAEKASSLVGIGFIVARHGQPERGLELASLGLNHPYMPKAFANSPLFARHLDAMRAELSADVYAAAWERGKSLDLNGIIQELIEAYTDTAG